MAKKIKLDRVWVILSSDGLHSTEITFDKAKEEAKKLREYEEADEVKILEVVAAWVVDFPEEPQPEVWKMELGEM